MPNRDAPTGSRITRLKVLLRRHRDLDDRIDMEQARPWSDTGRLKQLKLERLRLRDAIRAIRSTLMDPRVKPHHLN